MRARSRAVAGRRSVEDLQGLLAATSLTEVSRLLRRHAGELGFEWFVFALELRDGPPEARLALVSGYPEPWIEHYFRENLLTQDPVMGHCRTHVVPLAWDALPPAQQSGRVMNDAKDFGLVTGATAPLHGVRGELGVLSVATSTGPRSAPERVRHALPELASLACYTHESLLGLRGRERSSHASTLTARERECLLWVAEGKTSWEIGVILGTSERTVNFHVRNASIKLGVTSRQHAVARALMLGILAHG
jgi:DNA-binding CsgD family transcriptional regulator